jgi:hypothetical protein
LRSGVIGVLVESGRPIDAINLAYAFGLTEQFEPVQLLKAYLRDVKKVSHATMNVKMSPGAQVIFIVSNSGLYFMSKLHDKYNLCGPCK